MRFRYLIAGSVSLLTLIWVSLNAGFINLHNELGLLFSHGNAADVAIIQGIRGPRILAAILVGATLGIAGVLSQGVLKNPLADPVLLGTTGGASLATLAGILIFGNSIGSLKSITTGIIGAALATYITYQLGKSGREGFSFIVIGIAMSALLIALVGIFTFVVDKPEARGVTFWSLGTLSMATKSQVLFLSPILFLTWIGSLKISSRLDYLALGDIRARHLGVDVRKTRYFAFSMISISVGAITSVFGQISFLALAIPHLVRSIIGPNNQKVLIHSALLGANLLLLADLFSRTIVAPVELPIGLVTAVFGAPVLIFAIRRWVKINA